MIPKPAFAPLVALAAAQLSAARHHRRDESYGIDWVSCGPDLEEVATGPIQCANISVPLDYTDADNGKTHTLELMKFLSETETPLGSIIINFGGPGAEGLVNLATSGSIYSNKTGGAHDLISFNPRGTSKAFLEFSCYTSEEDRALGTDRLEYAESSDASLGRLWANGKVLADACASNVKDVGEVISTAFTARDVMQIVDALGDEDLDYFGMSYGTALGSTLAAMFPDRINRMVLDGVLNPHEYYNEIWDWETMVDVDAAFTAFLQECFAAGPDRCPLAKDGATVESTETAVYDLLETLKTEPIPFPQELVVYNLTFSAKTVDHDGVRGLIHLTMYHPGNFPLMAFGLDGLLTGNLTSYALWRDGEGSRASGVAQSESQIGIRCADKNPATRTSELSEIGAVVERAAGISTIAGVGSYLYNCPQWTIEPKERYEGGFRVKTKNPVLLISSTYDPVTPLVSAFNASDGLEGSVVLERKGFGHLAMAQPSECLAKALAAYYYDGTMPEEGTKCDFDKPLF